MKKINSSYLNKLTSHVRSLSLKNRFLLSSMRYERCAEFPLIVEKLQHLFDKNISMLDIGTGDSGLPTYLLKNRNWNITCIDQSDWVNMQKHFLYNSTGENENKRFSIIIDDFLKHNFANMKYDLITCISVIEHIDGKGDTAAIQKMASLLSPGGLLILTTPFNGGNYKEFYLNDEVYGKSFKGDAIFFQRHYDEIEIDGRLIKPSGLKIEEQIYFGEYGFQLKEIFFDPPKLIKPIKIFYQWLAPKLAQYFINYSDKPVSRKGMKNYTSSGIFLMMRK